MLIGDASYFSGSRTDPGRYRPAAQPDSIAIEDVQEARLWKTSSGPEESLSLIR